MSDPAVIVFLRAPETGRVKTRLTARVGNGPRGLSPDAALKLYRAFVEDTLEAAAGQGSVFLFFHPPGKRELVENWLGNGYPLTAQAGEDLGGKMAHAFRTVFDRGFERAVLVGTDIPELDPAIFDSAGKALEQSDAVIGPSRDGGYYLIGMNRPAFSDRFFSGMSWSTSRVLDDTLAVFRQHGVSYECLRTLNDVDTPEDLADLKKKAATGHRIGARTRRVLASCGG